MAIQPFGPWRLSTAATDPASYAEPGDAAEVARWPSPLEDFRPIYEALAQIGYPPPEARAMYLHEIGRFLRPGALIIRGARMVSLPDVDEDDPAAGFSESNLDEREAEQLARFDERRRAAAAQAAAEEGNP